MTIGSIHRGYLFDKVIPSGKTEKCAQLTVVRVFSILRPIPNRFLWL